MLHAGPEPRREQNSTVPSKITVQYASARRKGLLPTPGAPVNETTFPSGDLQARHGETKPSRYIDTFCGRLVKASSERFTPTSFNATFVVRTTKPATPSQDRSAPSPGLNLRCKMMLVQFLWARAHSRLFLKEFNNISRVECAIPQRLSFSLSYRVRHAGILSPQGFGLKHGQISPVPVPKSIGRGRLPNRRTARVRAPRESPCSSVI